MLGFNFLADMSRMQPAGAQYSFWAATAALEVQMLVCMCVCLCVCLSVTLATTVQKTLGLLK